MRNFHGEMITARIERKKHLLGLARVARKGGLYGFNLYTQRDTKVFFQSERIISYSYNTNKLSGIKVLKGHSHEDFADFWSELC